MPTGYSYAVSHSSTAGGDESMCLAYKIMGNPAAEDPGIFTLGGGAAGDDGFIWTGALQTGSNPLPSAFKPFSKGFGFFYLYQASQTSGK